jgi:hypothetical protein
MGSRDGRGPFMEESGEQCTVVFALTVTELASECIDVANSYLISYSNSSLLECWSSNPGHDMSVFGALVEDGDDLGKKYLHKVIETKVTGRRK